MLRQASQGARCIWFALLLAVVGAGTTPADAQVQDSQQIRSSTPSSDGRIVSFSFRPGELRDREAKAAEPCKQQNLGATLTAIEYSNSAEGFYYSAKFICGQPSAPSFPASYKQGDRARLEEDIAGYCKEHGGEMSRVASEPAPRADTFKATYECK